MPDAYRPAAIERSRAGYEKAAPFLTPRRIAIGAVAVGALAAGALAVGALAIGALAIARLSVGRSRFRSVQIDELTVNRLKIRNKDDRMD